MNHLLIPEITKQMREAVAKTNLGAVGIVLHPEDLLLVQEECKYPNALGESLIHGVAVFSCDGAEKGKPEIHYSREWLALRVSPEGRRLTLDQFVRVIQGTTGTLFGSPASGVADVEVVDVHNAGLRAR